MNSDAIIAIIAILGSGGFLGGIIAVLKLRSDRARIVVDTAQGAVIVQTSVIESLRQENERLSARIEELERVVATIGDLHRRISQLEHERDALRAENQRLAERIVLLERELKKLNGGSG